MARAIYRPVGFIVSHGSAPPGKQLSSRESVPTEEAAKTKKAYGKTRFLYRDPFVSIWGGSGEAIREDFDIP